MKKFIIIILVCLATSSFSQKTPVQPAKIRYNYSHTTDSLYKAKKFPIIYAVKQKLVDEHDNSDTLVQDFIACTPKQKTSINALTVTQNKN